MDSKNECTCKNGIKIQRKDPIKTALPKGVIGKYWLVRHYNYHGKPVYYVPGNGDNKELHLYFGEINNMPRTNGWVVNYEFGLIYNNPAIIFHDSDDDNICPEIVGPHWHTQDDRDIPDVTVTCL